MSELEKKLAESLTASNTEILPFLPYLLQDIWELGSSPKDIMELISRNIPKYRTLNILDLACGKGAVSVKLAKKFGNTVKGIDIVDEFIEFAKNKAEEYEVSELCEFVKGDINEAVKNERGYDLVILGAAGNILGKPSETLKKLAETVKENGYIVLDDAISYDGEMCPTRKGWNKCFEDGGLKLVAEKTANENELITINRTNQDYIINRAEELSLKYPDKAKLFAEYVDSQQAECDIIEADLICVTFLLQKK